MATFQQEISLFLQNIRKERTRQTYARCLNQFNAWYMSRHDGPLSVTLLTSEILEAFCAYLFRERHLSAASVNLHLSALRALLSFYGYYVSISNVKSEALVDQKPLTDEEIARLLNAAIAETGVHLRNRALVSLMLCSGLRVSEVVWVRAEDVRLRGATPHVVVRHPNGIKKRHVPLLPEALPILEAYMKSLLVFHTPMFSFNYSKPLSVRQVQRIVKRCAQEAQISRSVTPTLLRYTFAVRAFQSGADLTTLTQWLGYESVAVTRRLLKALIEVHEDT